MFAYAIVTGVKRGWLDEQNYGPVGRTLERYMKRFRGEIIDIDAVVAAQGKKYRLAAIYRARWAVEIQYRVLAKRIAGLRWDGVEIRGVISHTARIRGGKAVLVDHVIQLISAEQRRGTADGRGLDHHSSLGYGSTKD
jgi:hypothetical protein